jgi:hypothetical protein
MMGQDQDREFYVALGSHLELMGDAKVDARLIAEVLRSGDLRPLLAAACQTSTREKTEQERAAELEVSGWTCSPPRDALVATDWDERELGRQWVRFWGGTTALAAVVQPERTWPSREEGGGWEFRVRLFGARVSMETGTSAGSGATAVEAMRKADERLQALLDDARRRRLRINPS